MNEHLPGKTPEEIKRLRLVLTQMPSGWHEDAIQEAWLAEVEGRDPVTAAKNYAQSERRFWFGRPSEKDRARRPRTTLLGDRDRQI
jgi:hypothetical protein